MTTFGVMRPKLIAKMRITALMPSAIVALIRSSDACARSAICTRPLAILNRRTPGIIDTTEAKPMAANGMCQRRATGVRINPTTRHASRVPSAAPKQRMRQHADRHRPKQHLRRRGEEDAVSGDGDAGSDDVLPQRDGPAGLIDRQGDAEQRQAEQQSRRDRHDDEPCIGQARGAEMDAAIDEVERAIEDVRPGHQHHAWADRDQP